MTWCWHRWGKWTDDGQVVARAVVSPLGLPIPIEDQFDRVIGVSQRRDCDRCGKAQLREVRS